MVGVMTLEEQVAALTKVIEDLAKQAAEASLRELSPTKASTPSKSTPETLQTSPQQASSMPQRQPTKATNALVLSADGTISAAQLREFVLGELKNNQDEVTPS
ncbi:hypothetical protein LIER_06744 [Lithospermum erythrorhizon]|uniref:Uncharacterized protein n=1 Tax=Lithospermum erythrorhizon TaxID=34254 RepID=A0AAV3P729_LITER